MNLRETIKKILREDSGEKKHPILKTIIKRIIPDNSIYHERWTHFKYIITYSVEDLNITESENEDEPVYDVEIVLGFHKILSKGFTRYNQTETDIEFVSIDDYYDIPEYIWEDIEDGIKDKLKKVLPNVYANFDWVNKIGE